MVIAIRNMVNSSSSMMLDSRFQNKDNAKLLLKYFLVELSKKTGVPVEDLIEGLPVPSATKKNSGTTQQLRYGTAFSDELYARMDKLILNGYTNKAIADILGIHRNTVTNRRKKLRGLC